MNSKKTYRLSLSLTALILAMCMALSGCSLFKKDYISPWDDTEDEQIVIVIPPAPTEEVTPTPSEEELLPNTLTLSEVLVATPGTYVIVEGYASLDGTALNPVPWQDRLVEGGIPCSFSEKVRTDRMLVVAGAVDNFECQNILIAGITESKKTDWQNFVTKSNALLGTINNGDIKSMMDEFTECCKYASTWSFMSESDGKGNLSPLSPATAYNLFMEMCPSEDMIETLRSCSEYIPEEQRSLWFEWFTNCYDAIKTSRDVIANRQVYKSEDGGYEYEGWYENTLRYSDAVAAYNAFLSGFAVE